MSLVQFHFWRSTFWAMVFGCMKLDVLAYKSMSMTGSRDRHYIFTLAGPFVWPVINHICSPFVSSCFLQLLPRPHRWKPLKAWDRRLYIFVSVSFNQIAFFLIPGTDALHIHIVVCLSAAAWNWAAWCLCQI